MVIQALIQQYADDYIRAAASFSALISRRITLHGG
jgi:hypothetical protein